MVDDKLNVLSRLLGSYKHASNMKNKFLRMCVASKNDTMVKGRATGRLSNLFSKRNYSLNDTPQLYTTDADQGSRNESSLTTLTEYIGEQKQRGWGKNTKHMDSYMALTGATGVMKKDPMAAISRVIKWEKPFIDEACKPRQTYLNFQKWAPKHARKLFEVEDVYNAYQDTDVQKVDSSTFNSKRSNFNSTLQQHPSDNLFANLTRAHKRDHRSHSNIQISESNAVGLAHNRSKKTLIPMQNVYNSNDDGIEGLAIGKRLHVRGVPKSLIEFQSRNGQGVLQGSKSNLEIVHEKSNKMVVLPKVNMKDGDTSLPLSTSTGCFDKRASIVQSTANISQMHPTLNKSQSNILHNLGLQTFST